MTTAVATRLNLGRSLAREAGIAVGLAGLTAVAAKVAVPLPWTPVPATLQTAVVIFAGAACGPWRGAAAMLLYLAAGLAGAPVFAPWTGAGPAVLLAPSAGYLVAFPLAAWLAGRGGGRRVRWLWSLAGLAAVYALGAAWLGIWALAMAAPIGAAWVLLAGVLPFLPFDLAKGALAVWSAGPLRRRL